MRAEDVIGAFDDCRELIFGIALGRDNPYREDKATAQKWIDGGLTFVVAVCVFFEQMSWMHEKFLRYGQAKERSYLPASLKVFDENIEAAIRKQKGGGQTEFWETEISRWRSRCRGWKRNPQLWNSNQWGPAPFEAGSRIPKAVMEELR